MFIHCLTYKSCLVLRSRDLISGDLVVVSYPLCSLLPGCILPILADVCLRYLSVVDAKKVLLHAAPRDLLSATGSTRRSSLARPPPPSSSSGSRKRTGATTAAPPPPPPTSTWRPLSASQSSVSVRRDGGGCAVMDSS